MSTNLFPTIFVPIIGLVLPFVSLWLFFDYIGEDKIN